MSGLNFLYDRDDENVGRVNLRSTCNIINVIAQSNEEIKEQLRASVLHFQLHCATSFKCVARTDYESEVVSTELGVGVGSVSIGITCGGENR
jgi:hypothetical protein